MSQNISQKIIIIRFGEIHLKGKNKPFFQNLLFRNIKNALKDIKCRVVAVRSRYEVHDFCQSDQAQILTKISRIFGVHSFSVATLVGADFDQIRAECLRAYVGGTFKIDANRADKTYPMTSPQICCALGDAVLDHYPDATVDIHNPQLVINVDIRENGTAYVFAQRILGQGGMPTGSAGKGLLLLSGGIDSPVAGFMLAKRGMQIDAIHFHSYPYTSDNAKQKVIKLASQLSEYCGPINLLIAPLTRIQEAIDRHASPNYMITLVRRAMMRISETVAKKRHLGCLINGESLGQVASQTLASINVTNSVVESLPIFRPLIGMDKLDIISVAKRIETYETSILPYEDCCTVFLPEHPVIHPTIEMAQAEEARIPDYDQLISQSVDDLEVVRI